MLDGSPAKIADFSKRFNFDFWQLRTPLTANKLAGVPYGLDNGCFSEFPKKTWLRLIDEAKQTKPIFATMPDIVGDARRTLELFEIFKHECNGVPLGLVLQDGIENTPIPWNDISAVFVGGSDSFKISQAAIAACKTAKILGKWVHVGRVNGSRVNNWIGLADSIDGSGISRFDDTMKSVLDAIRFNPLQEKLL